jgi:hypothetical protein
MGGGLMQLVAYGAQDIYLTGNPQITFFKVVYRRHTNFSMEAIEQTWDGTETAAAPARCTSTIARNGDLLYRMYLEIEGRPTQDKANFTAASITNVELEIGGQLIDRQSGQWMNVWSHLTQPNPSAHVGTVDSDDNEGTNFQNMSGMGGAFGDDGGDVIKLWVPLQFWFCRNPGLALPLIALQYHEVIVKLTHNFAAANFDLAPSSNKLWADYIYLDTDERRRFAQVSHEYLIEQVQENTIEATASKSSVLNFNHPVKELIWLEDGSLTKSNAVAPAVATTTATYKLQLNGHDRFKARNFRYFTRTQIWQHHTGCGGLNARLAADTNINGALNDGIAVYSFALKPEEHQPSGTCNFSRIDDARIVNGAVGGYNADKIYAVNYNVLRIMSGMGGLAYSN